ncbi:phosphotransferase family protein [Desulfolutivibrio sulfoxidireducens]|uniref:phosphotransferase family protein n=1 Tax=Desulfolutivibrio sulfoxidireducens TaxID=2773299 RepID=UPI00159D37E7|nr:phosphotransferase [Desulfolutivibrio sulfoxidireducens]QLA20271.1 phosphotransferase [Desulfolutivibrio sulfoxidireducens]
MRTGTEEKTPILIRAQHVEDYLRRAFGDDARLIGLCDIAAPGEQGMKEFGYGKPVCIEFEAGGRRQSAVLSIMRGDKYGHQFYWDRAAILMFQNDASGRMEKHVRSIGLGYFDEDDALVPVIRPKEFFIVSEKAEGYDYYLDLERIRKGNFRPDDLEMAKRFARFLAGVHARKKDDADLYLRRVRNLIGASECIFGLVDAYPHPYEHFSPERFAALEKRIIDWRWKLRGFTHRLAEVHGDFHPWNILVRGQDQTRDFSVLDRSRGEWGEPADDVATMSINYLLFGLYEKPRLAGEFERLYLAFWETYLRESGDDEMLSVIAPFYVFRGLVIASPQWYPNHPLPVRQGLLRFLENVLEEGRFDCLNINKYME